MIPYALTLAIIAAVFAAVLMEALKARAYVRRLNAKTDYWRNRALHKKHGIPDPIMANPDARAVMRPREVVVTDDKLLPEHRKARSQ